MHWQTSRFRIDLDVPRVMGIVNVTPDSFSDGGLHAGPAAALAHCEKLLAQGAEILDIGAESSRPGALPVSVEEELERLLPVVRAAVKMGVPISIDTCKPQVMEQVLDLGADIINDIRALLQPGAMSAVAAHAPCGVCLMHMHREPATMQLAPIEGDALPQVLAFLRQRTDAARTAGVARERIVWDPGIGFGKTVVQNFALLARQRELLADGFPLLAGWSRKASLAAAADGSLGAAAALAQADRMVRSVVAAVLAVERGASIVRVHDVKETVAAVKIWRAAQPR
jgi:dihydropteroate synthase